MAESILDDVTVLEVGAYLSAPKSARLLAEFGAEVIKVEPPGTGTPFRGIGESVDGVTRKYLSIDRGKKSLALDLTAEEGAEAFLDLAAEADVLVENMSPGWMEDRGVGYEDVRTVNEEVIYCSVSGFGGTGPWKDRKAVDFLAQGMSGLASQNGTLAPDGKAQLSGWFAADETTAIYAAMSILAALMGGRGTHIDIGLLDALVGSFEDKAANFSEGNEVVPPAHPRRPGGPKGLFETATEPLTVWVLPPTPERWSTFWKILGLEEWVEEGKFVETEEITANKELVQRRVEERFRTEPREYWLERLGEADIMAAPVLSIEEALTHEQVRSRPVLSEETDERLGEYLQVNFPAEFSNYEVGTRLPAATLGEHTRELLERAGYSGDEIDGLYSDDVVG